MISAMKGSFMIFSQTGIKNGRPVAPTAKRRDASNHSASVAPEKRDGSNCLINKAAGDAFADLACSNS